MNGRATGNTAPSRFEIDRRVPSAAIEENGLHGSCEGAKLLDGSSDTEGFIDTDGTKLGLADTEGIVDNDGTKVGLSDGD
mmetsp:Transcript_7823/g.18067  ORF Transcript_7823/g.18067 Transcript_7823/m.18067 type:complete len:80 (-) Transcript_7823:1322-1561(-)